MTIDKKKFKAKKSYICNGCYSVIAKGQKYFNLFGMADHGDKPYRIKLCLQCEDREKG